MNPYTVLGVDPTATPDEIKQAFRRKAQTYHPDKGGDPAEMTAINTAYAVLSDPERRARYDATGSDKVEESDEDRARKQLLSFFALAMEEDGNVIQTLRKLMQDGEKAAHEQIFMLTKRVARLTTRRAKTSVKQGNNLLHDLIDSELAHSNERIQAFEEAVRINTRALELLKEYHSTEMAPLPRFETHSEKLDRFMSIGGFTA